MFDSVQLIENVQWRAVECGVRWCAVCGAPLTLVLAVRCVAVLGTVPGRLRHPGTGTPWDWQPRRTSLRSVLSPPRLYHKTLIVAFPFLRFA